MLSACRFQKACWCFLIVSLFLFPVSQANALGRNVSSFVLNNGLQVVVIPDHRAPVVTHMVWYKVGGADEPKGKSGIAHFLEHLMFKGTKKIPSGEFSKIIARNGGQDNAFTSSDYTAYFQRVAKDRLPLVMEMEADRMTGLQFTEKDMNTERKVVLEERKSRIDNVPTALLGEVMDRSFFLAHPYGIPLIGWEKEIENLGYQDVLNMYRKFYAPNNAILIVAGDVTSEEVRGLAWRYYGSIKKNDKIVPRKRAEEPEHISKKKIVLEDKRVKASLLRRVYLAPAYNKSVDNEGAILDVLTEVLGQGPTSVLYQKLVVEKKIATSVGTSYIGSQLDYGTLSVYALPKSGVSLSQLEKELEQEIDNFIQKGVSDKELSRAKNSLIAEAVYAQDSQSKMARIYGMALATGGSIKEVAAWPDNIEAVSTSDVKEAAKKYFKHHASTTGFLLPKTEKK